MECAIYHIFEIKFAHQRSEMLKMLNSNKPLSVLKAFLALEELDYTVLDAVEMNTTRHNPRDPSGYGRRRKLLGSMPVHGTSVKFTPYMSRSCHTRWCNFEGCTAH